MLGRCLAAELQSRPGALRIMSRRPHSDYAETIAADLTKPEQLGSAVRDIDVVIHSASSPYRQTWEIDVAGTRNLLNASVKAGVRHFVYVSITGVDRVTFTYFQAKHAAERIVEEGGVPFTIVRLTQFHHFVEEMLNKLFRWRICPLPKRCVLQPMDVREAAVRVAHAALAEPGGRLTEAGGPEIVSLIDLAHQSSGRNLVVPVPPVGSGLQAMARGALTCPGGWKGQVSFAQWLEKNIPVT
jgi:uncharacterized protein YbjT (DUF2867 family)